MAPSGRRNKKKVGQAIRPGDKRLINSISRGIAAAAAGGAEAALVGAASASAASAAPALRAEESSVQEVRAAQEGARTLFDIKDDGFVSALAITLVPRVMKEGSRRVAAVSQPFGFVCKLANRERLAVVVPAGYVTDFASIPRLVHFIISPFGKHAEAAVIHDWLYALGTPKDRKSRRTADKAFAKALRLLEVNFFKRTIMYLAVRLGGGGGYGLAEDFVFRNLEDLTVLDPLPAREPFMTSFALHVTPKDTRKSRMAAKAAATETPQGVVSGVGS
jgi:hypothetical protein